MSNAIDMCPTHNIALIQRPIERQTYEQRFCGVWHDCPQCHYSLLYQSKELIAQLAETPQPTQAQLDLFPARMRRTSRKQARS